MNTKGCFLLILSVFLLISACSRKGGNDVDTTEILLFENLTPEEKEKLFKSSGVLFRENQTLADNLLRIETSRDEQGMKTERYFYKNVPNLKHIEIFTLANGQKQILIHNENGTVKSLSENSLAWLAKASPAEITGDAQVYSEEQKQNPSAGIKINTLPPIVVKSTPVQLPTPLPSPEPTKATGGMGFGRSGTPDKLQKETNSSTKENDDK